MTFSTLRLFARAPADLDVMSAHVQDAVLQTGDMTFLDDKRRFVLVMNRFCWELPQKESLRVRSALQIGGILEAKRRNIRSDKPDSVLSLLAVRFAPNDQPGDALAGTVSIIFSGGGEIRLAVEACEAILEDITQPWATTRRPAHRPDSDARD